MMSNIPRGPPPCEPSSAIETAAAIRMPGTPASDICLQNDSISRRHALLHFNADNCRFVITDLGGNNGVIVNNIKQQSHELNDGDLVELGEVRLRFRSNVEASG